MTPGRVLSVAVVSTRAGHVVFHDGKLVDWGISRKAAKSAPDLVGFMQERINALKPTVVVTEAVDDRSRKGPRVKGLIASIAAIASHNEVLDVSVARPRTFPSKYEEAVALAGRFPEIRGYLPNRKRRNHDFEPQGMIIFEAIALAEAVINGPPEQLAAAMG